MTKYTKVAKSLNEEKRMATFVVLEPQDNDGFTTDLHGDVYSAEDIAEAHLSFHKCQKSNLMHMAPTESFSFVESYILQADTPIGEVSVKKGSWIATIQVDPDPSNDWIWDGIKSGRFNGLSIQCDATAEDLE